MNTTDDVAMKTEYNPIAVELVIPPTTPRYEGINLNLGSNFQESALNDNATVGPVSSKESASDVETVSSKFSHDSDNLSESRRHFDETVPSESSCTSSNPSTSQNHLETLKFQKTCTPIESVSDGHFLCMKLCSEALGAFQSPQHSQRLTCALNSRWRPLVCKYHYRYCDFKVDLLRSCEKQTCSQYLKKSLALCL